MVASAIPASTRSILQHPRRKEAREFINEMRRGHSPTNDLEPLTRALAGTESYLLAVLAVVELARQSPELLPPEIDRIGLALLEHIEANLPEGASIIGASVSTTGLTLSEGAAA